MELSMIKQRIVTHPSRVIGNIYQGTSVSPYSLPSYSEGVITTTYGNYGWPNPNHRLDVGAPFFQKRFYHTYGGSSVDISFSTLRYKGMMYATIPQYSMPSAIPTAGAYGSQLYDRMKPAQPSWDGLNAFVELKDLPGMLKQRYGRMDDLTKRSSRAADDWVGIQFGWLPLLRDIRNMVEVHRKSQSIMQQLRRDNGRPVRRRVQLFHNSSSTVSAQNGYNLFSPVLLGSMYATVPTATDTTTVTDRVWGSSQFRYWLPEGTRDIEWSKSLLRKIFGFNIRPSVVYNAIPWSWLTDWFTDFGSIVSNLDNGLAERLTADYFYVMRETRTYTRRESTCRMRQGSGSVTVSATSESGQITRSRLYGSPFGWGVTDFDLNPLQLSILGAIGFSRIAGRFPNNPT
nr:MAG: hypothetical protein 1 [Leviviridae sp.]